MSKPHESHGKYSPHQHPLAYVLLFLAVALGALAIVVASNKSSDGGDAAEPPVPTQTADFECTQAEPVGFELSDVEGKSLSEVEEWAAGEGKTVRVVVKDGQPLAATMDYNPDRINVQTEADTVIRYCNNG